ncbi:1-acyl-sn-glycerol-3-phosphate acyltransferase [Nocardia sp. CDC159]|uniref:1-acyl-sn-glycerol-3-phosphate acyltransferase n=1 Tax=Nocardia pulmonis TaxID=2951408 RepID=A0A9X2EBN7_9NOCA|nr:MULTISPECIES: lysophospholipid acyltransferase family protein [Nocardia]MCM6776520.1 1-acyl-sn-glycerol-3-phosphate acyltransferase [Nocardia pulmonis]MCM6788944.1 1-acyl-sn-glycerol-3-phosphate acyltransferase [Nocardia sp. CDC159]
MTPALLSPTTGSLSCPPAAPVHAWMPSSPCGPSCVDIADAAGIVRTGARVLGVVGLLFSFPAINLVTPKRRRSRLHRRYARTMLRCCGIRLRVIDERTSRSDDDARGLLVVAGHVGWTDVLALAAVRPMGFVARADLIDWPLLGGLARFMRVIPIERERLRQLPEVIAAMSARLAAGERIAMFPEGTTWCGRAHGRPRPALFQAAVDSGSPVQPIRLRYLDRDGELSTVPGFVGVDTFLDSARRVLRSKGVVAELVLLPLEEAGTDRHDLARRCEAAMRGEENLNVDAHATAVGTGPTRDIVPDPISATTA